MGNSAPRLRKGLHELAGAFFSTMKCPIARPIAGAPRSGGLRAMARGRTGERQGCRLPAQAIPRGGDGRLPGQQAGQQSGKRRSGTYSGRERQTPATPSRDPTAWGSKLPRRIEGPPGNQGPNFVITVLWEYLPFG